MTSGVLLQLAAIATAGVVTGTVRNTSNVAVGTFELNFADGENGVFTYTLPQFSIVNRTLPLQRLAIAGGAVNVCTVSKPAAVVSAPEASVSATASGVPSQAESRDSNAATCWPAAIAAEIASK